MAACCIGWLCMLKVIKKNPNDAQRNEVKKFACSASQPTHLANQDFMAQSIKCFEKNKNPNNKNIPTAKYMEGVVVIRRMGNRIAHKCGNFAVAITICDAKKRHALYSCRFNDCLRGRAHEHLLFVNDVCGTFVGPLWLGNGIWWFVFMWVSAQVLLLKIRRNYSNVKMRVRAFVSSRGYRAQCACVSQHSPRRRRDDCIA